MIGVIAENQYGQQIDFAGNASYQIVAIKGITPPKAKVNTAKLATKDGSVYNSSSLENRNIVMTIQPVSAVERKRLNIYTYFKSKRYVKLYLSTHLRSVWTEGYVDSIEIDMNVNPQMIQVSIICPDPYLKAVDTVEHSGIVSGDEIENTSDEEIGAVFTITAAGAASSIAISNETTGETFTFDYALQSGDKVVINTQRGEKAIRLTRSGTTTNLINSIDINSEWISFVPGENEITYTAESGTENIMIDVTLQPIFEGV